MAWLDSSSSSSLAPLAPILFVGAMSPVGRIGRWPDDLWLTDILLLARHHTAGMDSTSSSLLAPPARPRSVEAMSLVGPVTSV